MNLALAVKYGTNESLFLTNLCFWIEKNKANRVHFHDGYYWVYNTMDAWAELFPYFTKDQIRRIIDKLRRDKVIRIGVFNRTRYDRTQWYTVSGEVTALYLGKTPVQRPDEAELPESPICPPGLMDVGKSPHPSASQGRSKRPICHIEAADLPHRSDESPTPIPYNKHIYKPVAASSKKETKQKTAAAAEPFLEKLKTVFSELDGSLVFEERFYPEAAAYLDGQGLGFAYPAWLYTECRKRNPESLRGLYFKLFFEPDMLALYRNREKELTEEAEKKKPVPCPACGTPHPREDDSCPECGIEREKTGEARQVEKHRRYHALTPEDKRAYEAEMAGILRQFPKTSEEIKLVKDRWVAVEKKYHLLE
jgi:rubrerythrin